MVDPTRLRLRIAAAALAAISFLVTITATGPAAAGTPDALAPVVLPLRFSRGPAVGDLDGDGCVDLAFDDNAGNIVIFLGGGTHLSTRGITVPVGERGTAPLAVDFDSDGMTDLIDVAMTVDNVIRAHRSLGDLTFAPPIETPLGASLVVPTYGDLDADGSVDIVIVDSFPGDLSVFLGRPDGGFDAAGTASSPLILDLTAADDLDGDGNVDVALADFYGSRIIVLPGDGLGGLGSPREVGLPFLPNAVESADLDADGAADLVAAGKGLAVLRSVGAGGFEPPSTLALAGTPADRGLGVADFDEDGRLDVLVAEDGFVEVFAGDGLGGLEALANVRTNFSDGEVAIDDLDGDGHLDVVTRDDIQAYVLFGDGEGSFRRSTPPIGTVGEAPRRVIVADFDADGYADAAALSFGTLVGTGDVTVLPSDGRGALKPALTSTAGARPVSMTAGDFDEDGDPDLAVGKLAGSPVFLLENDGTGRFSVASTIDPGSGAVPFVMSGDFDGDSHVDLLLKLSSPPRLAFLAGDGSFGFDSASDAAAAPDSTSDMVVFDMNSDSTLDVVVVERSAAHVLLGDGHGGFVPGAPTSSGADQRFGRASVADLDGDGHPDLVTNVFILQGDGAGGLAAPLGFADVAAPSAGERDVVLTDFDGDGILDYAASLSNPTALEVLPGDGSGGFAEGRLFGIGSNGVTLDAGDFDGDGRVDLLGIAGRSEAWLLLNASVDPIRSRAGNVNAAAGAVADVLFVNGSAGVGAEREIVLGPGDAVEIRVESPPSRATARFALYGWMAAPAATSTRDLAFGLGGMALPPPLAPACRYPVAIVWNNIVGHDDLLGVPDRPSSPAPSVVARLARGLGPGRTAYFQGIIVDGAARNGRAAVTNGILLRTP